MSRRKANTATLDLVVSRDPEVMGGQPVFAGTRVPITHLIELLVAGRSVDEFAHSFPTVEPKQAREFLQRIGEMVRRDELTV